MDTYELEGKTAEIVSAADKTANTLTTEPHSGWGEFWRKKTEDIQEAHLPENSTYFEQIPLMAFSNGEDVVGSFCLEHGQQFEFFLNLDSLSTNGNDVFAIALSTSRSIEDALVID